MSTLLLDKKADLAGPGIGDYRELEKILPRDYQVTAHKERHTEAIFRLKRYIEDNLCKELNLMMVEVPADRRCGERRERHARPRWITHTDPVSHSNDRDLHPVDAQVVQAATKWKRCALKQFDCRVGEGICTDMRAVRKDYFLDHDHSAYVDQWDWERVITAEQRNLEFLKGVSARSGR